MKMPYGQIKRFAVAADCHSNTMHNYLTGRRSVRKPDLAKRLARLTNTDPFLWMAGGSPQARQAAIQAWSENSLPQAAGEHIQNMRAEI